MDENSGSEMKKAYICDGNACDEVKNCYLEGGTCWHTLNKCHSLSSKYRGFPKTTFEGHDFLPEDQDVLFETVETKDLIAKLIFEKRKNDGILRASSLLCEEARRG